MNTTTAATIVVIDRSRQCKDKTCWPEAHTRADHDLIPSHILARLAAEAQARNR